MITPLVGAKTWQLQTWQELRQRLETRRQQRTHRRRFHRDPALYLAKLEADLLQLID